MYYESVLGRKLKPIIVQRPRKEKKLPSVLSEEEIAELFKQVKNLKHRCMLYLVYSAGLRRSEVLSLRPADIDSSRSCIVIRNAKGKKDRITILSEKILSLLRDYYKRYKPKEWLFEGALVGSTVNPASEKYLKMLW
jgi:integrase